MTHDTIGQHSRVLTLVAGVSQLVFAVTPNRDAPVTWLFTATNQIDGNTPIIQLTVNETGPSGVTIPVTTEIGPRESVQIYITGAVNITAAAAGNTSIAIQATAIGGGGGAIPVPPVRFTDTVNAVNWTNLSLNSGYAPPGLRWFTVYSLVDFDLQFRTAGGGALYNCLACVGNTPFGPHILPPGLKLIGKGNLLASTLTAVWTQRRDG